MISKLKKLLTVSPSEDDIANENFKRRISYIIIVGNNKYIIGLGIIITIIFIFSGSGEGLEVLGTKIKPISETAIALLSSISGYLLKSWQDEKQLIISYYFFNQKKEEEIKESKESTKYDLHQNPLTQNGNNPLQ